MAFPVTKSPSIFDTTPIAADDPILARPVSKLPLDWIAEAARTVTAFPGVSGIQKYRREVVTLRLTVVEFDQLMALRAEVRTNEVVHTAVELHRS
jgi:hypothetical protein